MFREIPPTFRWNGRPVQWANTFPDPQQKYPETVKLLDGSQFSAQDEWDAAECQARIYLDGIKGLVDPGSDWKPRSMKSPSAEAWELLNEYHRQQS